MTTAGATASIRLKSLLIDRKREEATMGIKANITATDFPAKGLMAGKRVRVCFHHDMSRPVERVVLRDDIEEPFRTIIHLDDGRAVLDTECQFQPL